MEWGNGKVTPHNSSISDHSFLAGPGGRPIHNRQIAIDRAKSSHTVCPAAADWVIFPSFDPTRRDHAALVAKLLQRPPHPKDRRPLLGTKQKGTAAQSYRNHLVQLSNLSSRSCSETQYKSWRSVSGFENFCYCLGVRFSSRPPCIEVGWQPRFYPTAVILHMDTHISQRCTFWKTSLSTARSALTAIIPTSRSPNRTPQLPWPHDCHPAALQALSTSSTGTSASAISPIFFASLPCSKAFVSVPTVCRFFGFLREGLSSISSTVVTCAGRCTSPTPLMHDFE